MGELHLEVSVPDPRTNRMAKETRNTYSIKPVTKFEGPTFVAKSV